VSGKSYIGSSVNLSNRFKQYFNDHELKKNNMAIYKALLKHGHSNFFLEIIKYCKPKQCLTQEQYCLDHLEHEYNISPTAGSRLGSRHSFFFPL
jgi:group I intron endonuclease